MLGIWWRSPPPTLTLRPEGYTVRTWRGEKHRRWSDVARFAVYRYRPGIEAGSDSRWSVSLRVVVFLRDPNARQGLAPPAAEHDAGSRSTAVHQDGAHPRRVVTEHLRHASAR
jgi:hypothetical protein